MQPNSRTPYETSPVESLADAIKSFALVFSDMQRAGAEAGTEAGTETGIKAGIKAAMFKPVYPIGGAHGPISLVELGFMYVPDKDGAGAYCINAEKLESALADRAGDVEALFTQRDGLLGDIIPQLEELAGQDGGAHGARAFLNECRRLSAMF